MEEDTKRKHFFDLKIPLGSLLSAYGVILLLYGLFGAQDVYGKSLGININLVWGLVMLVVGGLFLGFHFLKRS